MSSSLLCLALLLSAPPASESSIRDQSPLIQKAAFFQQDLLDKHWLDGWLKPTVTAIGFSCDDPLTAWFTDSGGRIFVTLDGGRVWKDMSSGLMGARVQKLAVSPRRTFVLWAQTDQGVFITRDGGMSWRSVGAEEPPAFPSHDFSAWAALGAGVQGRIDDQSRFVVSRDNGKTVEPAMQGWRIPLARSWFHTPWGAIASGPGGCYRSHDGKAWEELKVWQELETGAADFLHAYWMGRYYGLVTSDE